MIEVLSGNIQIGVRYTVGNITTPPGTGTITYNSIVYNIGQSFVGQFANDTYVATLTAKVYEDDTLLTVLSQATSEIEEELTPYPENLTVISQVTAENFNENEEVVYPENVHIFMQVTVEARRNRSQIINRS